MTEAALADVCCRTLAALCLQGEQRRYCIIKDRAVFYYENAKAKAKDDKVRHGPWRMALPHAIMNAWL